MTIYCISWPALLAGILTIFVLALVFMLTRAVWRWLWRRLSDRKSRRLHYLYGLGQVRHRAQVASQMAADDFVDKIDRTLRR